MLYCDNAQPTDKLLQLKSDVRLAAMLSLNRRGGRYMDILTQLNLAIDYIETHICDDISLVDVAAVTNYSEYL